MALNVFKSGDGAAIIGPSCLSLLKELNGAIRLFSSDGVHKIVCAAAPDFQGIRAMP